METTRPDARNGAADFGAWSLWWRWAGACCAGELVSAGIAVAAAAVTIGKIPEPHGVGQKVATFLGAGLIGAVEGALFGAAQWTVLRMKLRRVAFSSWLKASVAAAAGTWMLGVAPFVFLVPPGHSTPPSDMPPALTAGLLAALGLGVGAFLGSAQYLVIARVTRRAGWWILANTLGWTAGVMILFEAVKLANLAASSRALWIEAAGLALAGLAVGTFTGLSLVRLESRPTAAAGW